MLQQKAFDHWDRYICIHIVTYINEWIFVYMCIQITFLAVSIALKFGTAKFYTCSCIE